MPSDAARPTDQAVPAAEVPTVVSPPAKRGADAPTMPPAPNPAELATLAPTPNGGRETLEALAVEKTALEVNLQAGVLGPYREVQPLRSWKHGTVYAAVHPMLRRRVLLRVLSPEHVHTAIRDDFLRIGQAVAALDHPHVAGTLFEAAAHANVVFVAHEDPSGQSLNEFGPRDGKQRRTELLYPNHALAQAMLEAALGLEAIHKAGLSHGQLSPECIRRGSDGRVRIYGLGEAPVAATNDGQDGAVNDIFDFGVAFTRIAVGAPLEVRRVAKRHQFARRLRRSNPGLSLALANVLERCTTSNANRRFREATELVNALRPLTQVRTQRASWGDRLGTQLYDGLLTFCPALLLLLILMAINPLRVIEQGEVAYILLAFFITYVTWETTFGWTPGRRMRGLALRDYSGDRPARVRLLVRGLLRLGCLAVMMIAVNVLTDLLLAKFGSPELRSTIKREGLRSLPALTLSPLLAMAGVYLTARYFPHRLPLHDWMTGITWCVRQRPAERFVDETGEVIAASTVPRERTIAEQRPPRLTGQMDHYQLGEMLGQGGMGAVYAAYDTTLNRRVALKVLSGSLPDNPTLIQRFEREARLAAQLSHPNVARVYGFGQADGKPYMVMEFIPGQTLQQLVQHDGPLALSKAWDYASQAALALREAARLGIVHRDIKPSNLMLTQDGVIKVTDFGISRASNDAEIQSSTAAPNIMAGGSLTRTGALMGTPMYMSPEQARGEKLDPRSDIYSLGLTLHFLLSGQDPYPAGDIYDLVVRQCTEEPTPLFGLVRDCTPDRAAVLRKMIAKDPADRFQNCEALLRALKATAPRPAELASFLQRAAAEFLNSICLWIVVLLWRVAIAGSVFVLGQRVTGATPWQILFGNDLTAWMRGFVKSGPLIIMAMVYVLGIGWYGQTPGKWCMGLKVLWPGHRSLGLRRSLLRLVAQHPVFLWILVALLIESVGMSASLTHLLLVVIGIPVIVGGLFIAVISVLRIIFTAKRWGVHDLLTGTVVLSLPKKRARRHAS